MLLIQQYVCNLSLTEEVSVIVVVLIALVVMWPKRKR